MTPSSSRSTLPAADAALAEEPRPLPPASPTQRPGTAGELVLILAPTGRDAALLADQISRGMPAGDLGPVRRLAVEVCPDIEALCRRADDEAGALLIAEEALAGAGAMTLRRHLERQPPWSDIGVILIGQAQGTGELHQLARWFGSSGSITLLERPVRLATLFSVLDAALRARRRQHEVRRLLRESRLAVEQRDRFLAMLGHELRNPLAAIVNSVNILRHVGPEDGEVAEQCDVISRQSSHMARLVDDLLDVARITAGKIALERRVLDLRDLAQRAVQAMRLAVGSQRHEIVIDTPGEAVWVEADAVRLEQVLVNLLTNSVKYTPGGGRISITVRTVMRRARDGETAGPEDENTGTVGVPDRPEQLSPSPALPVSPSPLLPAPHEALISVCDTGEGLPADLQDRLFEPFVQGAQTLERSRGGLGIGLTVVKALVDLHGGRVEAISDGPGCGSEFRVYLPLTTPPPPSAPAPRVASPAARPRRILIVEDNSDSRRTLAKLLRLAGHTVATAEDGPGGLDAALENSPEVALLDIGLPGFDGFELARRLRAHLGHGVYLIALTGYGRPEDRQRVEAAGFDVHLVKPVDSRHLSELLARLPRPEMRISQG